MPKSQAVDTTSPEFLAAVMLAARKRTYDNRGVLDVSADTAETDYHGRATVAGTTYALFVRRVKTDAEKFGVFQISFSEEE